MKEYSMSDGSNQNSYQNLYEINNFGEEDENWG
jgi:hypothetical protein